MTGLSPFDPPKPVRTPLSTSDAAPIALGAGLPVLAALDADLSVGSVAAGVATGALMAGGILMVLRHRPPTVATCLGGGSGVGAICGLAWWTLQTSSRSLTECLALGALAGAAVLALELYRRARRAED